MPILSVFVLATIAACTTATPPAEPGPPTIVTADRPLQVTPGDAALSDVRNDLLVTATDRFGQARLDEALAAPATLIAKRFAGMLPPPPPGETAPAYVPPAALLMKGADGWLKATATGWTPLKAEQAAELDAVIANPAFWSESASVQACPDYGSSQLLLKTPGNPETVRNSQCTSVAEKAVQAALNG
ncbi:hypothetical protein H8M03_02720 [Sphingomonas sabuli]|uniref:Uncharacterized protein n=1 Tax=Sphingomonas sabuli TaxID=2764186 RepID=A0A7G9L3S7_9SPHN|nr:hypothetical protein [Sphingomonas sabuli]QNM83276.1 hypothetical protein H8M03_02720 [Sphingomonas sabuli]